MADYELSAKITADSSSFEKAIKKAQSSTSDFSKKMSNATDNIKSGANKWGLSLDTFYKKGSSIFKSFGLDIDQFASNFGVSGKVVAAIVAATVAIEKFGEKIQAMTAQLVQGTGATGEALYSLKDSAQDALINGVGRSAEEVGKMVAELNTRFDVTGDTLTEMTDRFDKFAKVTGTDTKVAIDSVADVVYKWGLNVEDTNAVMDQLTVASQMSGASIDKLTSGLKSGEAVFSQLGFSLTDTIALESALAKQGIDTGTAITGMKTAIGKFAAEGKNASVAFKEISSQIKNAETETEALNLAVQTFGTRSGPDMLKILRDSKFSIDDFKDSLMSAGGAIERTEEASRTTKDALNDMKGVFVGTFAGIGEGVANIFRDIIDTITMNFQQVAQVLRPVMDVIGDVLTFVGSLMKTLTSNMIELGKRITSVFSGFTNVLKIVRDSIRKVLGNVLDIFKDAFGLIFAILDGKWGLAWEYAKNAMMKVADAILNVVSTLINAFGTMVNSFINAINKLIDSYNDVADSEFGKFLNLKKGQALKLMPHVDLSEVTGLNSALEESNRRIEELSGKKAKKLVGDIGTGDLALDPIPGGDSGKPDAEQEKFLDAWSDRRYKTILQELQTEYELELENAEAKGMSVEQKEAAIYNNYLSKKLKAFTDEAEKERAVELEKASKFQASAETIANINKFYDDKINDYKLTQVRATNKAITAEYKKAEEERLAAEKKAEEERKKIEEERLKRMQKVISTVKNVASKIKNIFMKVIDLNMEDLLNSILEIEDKILTFFMDTLPKIPEYFSMVMDSIVKLITAIAGNPQFVKNIVGVILKVVDIIIDNFPTLFSAVLDITVQLVTELVKKLPQILEMLFKAVGTVIESLVKGIWDQIVKAFENVGKGISQGWNWIGDKLGWWATGVNNAPSGLAVVGEQGPELVDFKGGERVYNNADTMRLLSDGGSSGGNSFNITFNNMQDTTAFQVMRQLRDYNRQMAINGVL